VYGANLELANVLRVLESVAENTLGCLAGDELDALNHAIDNNMLDSRVLSFGVFTDQDGVYIVIWGFVAFERAAGSDVGEEVKGSSEGKVERDMTLANGSLQRVIRRESVGENKIMRGRTARGPLRAT